MELHKVFTFEAAHKLPNVPPEHKCARLHGHSFRLEIHVSGPVDQQKGWIIDFEEVTKAFYPILQELDHNYLNEIKGLENPTSENILLWIWGRLKPRLPLLSKLVLNETCTSGCSYTGV